MGKRLSSKEPLAAIVGDNDDLLTEILLLLPAKSLVRFKLVSQHWRSLISSESFYHRHLLYHGRRRPEQHSLILCVGPSHYFICDPTIKRLIPLRLLKFRQVKILHSCNGLLLLECGEYPTGYRNYYVFNPTTKQSRKLCHIPGVFCLMFDPSKSHHYKVVRFRNKFDRSIYFDVYDSTIHKWVIGGECQLGPHKSCNSVFWNNRVYFIKHRDPSFCFAPEDKFRAVPKPPRTRLAIGSKNYVVESNGHLHYLSLYLRSDMIHLKIFEMIDDKWLFFKLAILPCSDNTDSSREIGLLGMMREQSMDDSTLLIHVPGQVLSCRLSDKVSEVLVDFRSDLFYQEGRLQLKFEDSYPFIPSLAPV